MTRHIWGLLCRPRVCGKINGFNCAEAQGPLLMRAISYPALIKISVLFAKDSIKLLKCTPTWSSRFTTLITPPDKFHHPSPIQGDIGWFAGVGVYLKPGGP